MIQANELRIGNIIFELEIITVKSILERGVNADERGAIIPFDMLCGIPLSPEILEACGFESVRPTMMPGYAFYRSKSFDGRHRFRWEIVEGFAMETVGSGWLWHFKDIKYLHQIQNFTYSITGTELTINIENVKV